MEKLKAGDWYIWNNNKQICSAEEDQLDILNKHLANNDIQKLQLKKEKMKIVDKLKPSERALVAVIVTIFLMFVSVVCSVCNYIIVPEIVSWQMALLISPFILFAVSMVIYDHLFDKEHGL